ncbi:hypothetical protein Bca101_023719 [Brassica carinata]
MCQLRRSHAACARDSVSSARCWFLQLSSDGCDWLSHVCLRLVAGSTIWEVIEFRAVYYLTVEEMKRYGAKRGEHTCASLSYDSESSVEPRAARPSHVKLVMLDRTNLPLVSDPFLTMRTENPS